MADEARRGDDEDRGPGSVYQVFEVMSDLIEKLKLMDYEENFLRKNNMKPFNRHYFALPTNPGEQFHAFTSLCAWLLNIIGRPFDMPQEYDDPNATISSILEEVKRLGVSVDFPPSKLKQGCGEYVCYIIDRLTEAALKSSSFHWSSPIYPEEAPEEDAIQEEDTAELKLDQLDDDVVVDEAASDEEEGTHYLDLKNAAKTQETRQIDILQSTTNVDDWKLEVERVTPSLKVTFRPDNKDWRTHVDQMHHHKVGIESSLVETKSHLDKLHDEIGRTLEKISSREKYINNQLEHLVQQYRSAQDELAQAKEKYRQGSGGVTERSRSLAEITEELEKVKHEMEDRGSSMTDGAPLVKIKRALDRLKTESTQMDIRIGVIEHILMQARMRDKSIMHNDMNRTIPSGNEPGGGGGQYDGFTKMY